MNLKIYLWIKQYGIFQNWRPTSRQWAITMLKHGINDSTYDYICSHLCHLWSHEYVVDLDSWLLLIVLSMVIIIYVIHPHDFHDYNQDYLAFIKSFNPSPWIFYFHIIKYIFIGLWNRYYRTFPYSTWHSTQHWLRKTPFHPCELSVEVISDLELVARCPLWFHHALLPSIQVHQFPLKIHYAHIQMDHNHRVVVWMSSFPLGLTWMEVH